MFPTTSQDGNPKKVGWGSAPILLLRTTITRNTLDVGRRRSWLLVAERKGPPSLPPHLFQRCALRTFLGTARTAAVRGLRQRHLASFVKLPNCVLSQTLELPSLAFNVLVQGTHFTFRFLQIRVPRRSWSIATCPVPLQAAS